MTAGLPMYDWPEIRPATDALWAALRAALAREGVAAPAALDRERPLAALWTDPGLVLAETCGLPLIRLLPEVAVVGVLDRAVPGAGAGGYRSALVVRTDDPRDRLAAFRGATAAINDPLSQSGWGALLHHAARLAEGRFFGRVLATGAHVASAAAVAEGRADVAAIDCVSWRLVRRFRPEAARRLRVLGLTDPTPALPIIAAPGADPAPLRRAVAAALDRLAPGARTALGIAGFVPLTRADYRLVADRMAAAEARLPAG